MRSDFRGVEGQFATRQRFIWQHIWVSFVYLSFVDTWRASALDRCFIPFFCVVLFSRRLLRDVALPSCQGIRPGLFRVPVWFLPLNPGAETFRAVRVTLVLGRSVWCDCAPREGWLRARVSSVVLFSFSLALGTLDSRGRYLVLGYLLRVFSAFIRLRFLRLYAPT